MPRVLYRAAVAATALLLVCGIGVSQAPAAPPGRGGPDPAVIFLDQGWSQADREWYYQFSQGSSVLPYDIFLHLEVANGQELFRSNANSDRYGLITQPANARTNPDGLPVGLSKTTLTVAYTEGEAPGDYVGLTCAACHNGQLHYQGKRVRIEGGVGNTFDFLGYIQALDDAMQATLRDTAKFDRLAARMRATNTDDAQRLRKDFAREAAKVHEYRSRNVISPVPWGPGRIDAITLIVNRLVDTLPHLPENWSTPLAPTKPPFLWNAPQGLWTQWRGSQQDPIRRNLVETMGVFLSIDLHSKSPAEGLFQSNAPLAELVRVEELLARLAPPSWPENVLGKIDREKAKEGKALFVELCASCHNAWPYTWTEPNAYGKRFVRVGLVPQSYVGTDPGQFTSVQPFAITGHLAEDLQGPLQGQAVVPTGALFADLRDQILAAALAKHRLTPAEAARLHGYRELPIPEPPEGIYKAAPREGVWATPPFLHNGSVPNLYEVLLPAGERSKKFYVGREFDPAKVGLDTSGASGRFSLDTTLPGNSNAGHSFESAPLGKGVIGPLLSEDQRWAIIEYLKSIPETPGRVTPFGGPRKER